MSSLAVDRRGDGAIQPLRVLGAPPASATPGLIEREAELEALAEAVGGLATGRGGVVVLQAAAGLGKSALLEHAAQLLSEAGCVVRRSAPGRRERDFAFGVIRTLLEPALRGRSGHDRRTLLDGPAAMAGALLLDGSAPALDATTMLAHSILWLCARLAERRPLGLVVDDAQWADRASLQVLAYLARRIDDVPLLIMAAARDDAPGAATDIVAELGTVHAATVLHPQPLTASGAVQLIRRHASDTPTRVCCECHRAAAGSPWLIAELGRQIAGRGDGARSGSGDAGRVTSYGRAIVRRRMAECPAGARALAATLAVIGEDVAPQVLASVAGIPVPEVGCARDALRSAGILGANGQRFTHGVISRAIRDDLTPTQLERLHRDAALALIDSGASADVVAGHLLRCLPRGDPVAGALLVRAASATARRGAPALAATYLERALAERAPGQDRGHLLAELAVVAFDAALPDARQRLHDAWCEANVRANRVDVLIRLAALGAIDSADGSVEQVLEELHAEEGSRRATLEVEAAALDVLLTAPSHSTERARRARAVRLVPADDPLLTRVVTAHRAWLATELGAPDAAGAARLALDALDGDLLLREACRRPAYHLATRVLVKTDRVEPARAAIAALREKADVGGSLRLRAAAAWYESELALRTGHIADAETNARLAIGLAEGEIDVFSAGAIGVLVAALAERGTLEEAREILIAFEPDEGSHPWKAGLQYARARLCLAEGDFERAHADACAAGAVREWEGRPNPAWTPWRSTAALALAHIGRRDEAAALADAELARAERFGAPGPIARALHARAVAEPDDYARATLCRRGMAVLDGTTALLESVRLRLELGSTLAYIGHRIEARDALRPALADADALGADPLAQRARRELVATGLRPRRAALEGVAALTPRQRQICEQAAAGRSNRAIAHALFLSIKTVETHLAAGYRKLGVNSRHELALKLHE